MVIGLCLLNGCKQVKKIEPTWPKVSQETKPWTRWWWHGSAVTKEGITTEMEAYQKAGIGGLEITPIYGVAGFEDQFIDFLSPKWMELFIHSLAEAKRLDMGIDMATGTGWPFGGPWVRDEDACKDMNFEIYQVSGGQRLKEKIEFIQQPYLRAIGNSVFQKPGDHTSVRLDPKTIDIKKLRQPVGANKNLQLLALEQVKFEKPLALQTLMAYGEKGEVLDLTLKVSSGQLDWTAPAGNWKLYAVFQGWHGKMVERAGPGGEGNVIDHFSSTALKNYLNHFDSAFSGNDVANLRAFFNDSYEVDDARGTADWTPTLFDEFKKLQGYDLREHLPELFGNEGKGVNPRILCDYRETISELLLKNFTQPWVSWSHGHEALVRNQAHGSPSNILDLYATVDIPEIEGTEPLRIKMASSAGNVTGKQLVSSESATWLNEHFESTLAEVKVAVDRFMLNGVNHIFYHGTAYSPPGDPWPGWLFYAAVHFSPRNPMWNDFGVLNAYVARCQSFLQNSTSDNDVLLYYPVYDRFSTPGNELIEHFDGIGRQFANTSFERGATSMMKHGYAFDYISDKQIEKVKGSDRSLETEGGSVYQTLVIPHGKFIPLKTFQNLYKLAEAGATIIALEGLPDSTAGFEKYAENEQAFQALKKNLQGSGKSKNDQVMEMAVGKGRFLVGDSLHLMLEYASIRREKMVDSGIQFIRKKSGDGELLYFISNISGKEFEGWLPLLIDVESAILFDPMDGMMGESKLRKKEKGVEVYVRLSKDQSLLIKASDTKSAAAPFPYYDPQGSPVQLTGPWKITFTSGGPELPAEVRADSLVSWTTFGSPVYTAFSGTAVYSTEFTRPTGDAKYWKLDLGDVKESAEVVLNGKSLGALLGPSFQLVLQTSMINEKNVLEIKVSNSMANRIADLEQRPVVWKKFYNINFPARKAENRKNGLFDATAWKPKDSGLLGPVRLFPLEVK